MKKHPYTFPHKSKSGMMEYLMDHKGYGGWNHPYRGWSPLAWCVKINDIDVSGGWGLKHHEHIDPLLDEEWAQHWTENQNSLTEIIFEDAQITYREGLYTTYPGNDQGDWKFCFGGRSGGWLILEKWKNDDSFLKMGSKESWEDYLSDLFFSGLRALYRGVRCMDQDFTRENASRNVSYQINFQRTLWEEQIIEENKVLA